MFVFRGDKMSFLEAISDEDRLYVKRYIILPFIISAFERDSKLIEKHFKSPEPYMDFLKIAIKRANEDFQYAKKHFFKRGLKITSQSKTVDGLMTRFKCRGYESEMELRWEFISAEASILMRKFMGLDISIYEDVTLPEDLRNKY